jgi:hypothetical protein
MKQYMVNCLLSIKCLITSVYCSPNASYSDAHIKADEMGGVCGRSGSKTVHSTGFDGGNKGNRQLGRSRHRWKAITCMLKKQNGGGRRRLDPYI